MCYSAAGAEKLLDGLTEERCASFLDMLSEIGHESPVEHASFTFAVEGVSRSLLAQLTRHRIASFSVQSQRYVSMEDFEYVTPPEIAADPEALKEFEASMRMAAESYSRLHAVLKKNHKEKYIASGMDEKEADKKAGKMANEDARFVLPNACETKLIMTMNARELRHFFRLRCCGRAQWEIREMAWLMLELCMKEAPHLFATAGPACLTGPCPEGKMCCGMAKQMKERWESLC